MQIKYFCAWWGLDHLGLEGMVKKVKAAGFDGLETFVPEEKAEAEQLKRLLQEQGLEAIAHQFQAEGDFYAFRKSYRKRLEQAAEFGPLLINSHTGRDYWSPARNGQLIEIADEVAEKYGVKIVHETHRGRFLFSTFAAHQYFDAYPELRINADFSHWTCVSESLLEDQPIIMAEAIRRTEHIHARVGHAQGPQVSDPRDPHWQQELATFVGWWQRIVDRFVAEERPYLSITPEFGPPPYTNHLPDTGRPVSDFFEINCWMKDYLQKHLKY